MGTGPVLVPKSNVIRGNQRVSALRRRRPSHVGSALQSGKQRLDAQWASPHRTQEAAGSSPASSIAHVHPLLGRESAAFTGKQKRPLSWNMSSPLTSVSTRL
jgi:hypothetical protein